MNRLLGELYVAAKDLFDAYGGDVPSWLRKEAGKVEEMLFALRGAVGPGAAAFDPQHLGKLSGPLGDLYDAAKDMLDAYGGDTPDWLRDEAVRTEDAIFAIRELAVPVAECEPVAPPAAGLS
jgi:hypothetical protein